MRILKFGGTSVANSEAIEQVARIVQKLPTHDPAIVVVSAFSQVTNKLEKIAELAAQQATYTSNIEAIKQQHRQVANNLFKGEIPEDIQSEMDVLLTKLVEVTTGISLVDELTPRAYGQVVSFGERLSSLLISGYLQTLLPNVSLLNPREFIYTQAGSNQVDFKKTNAAIKSQLSMGSGLFICPGFIASSTSGYLSVLGRGGSDYTAAILAAALQAEQLEIWTDVSGMMTADPRMVKQARVIEKISYEEALELSHFGAKVIYPPSLMPVLKEKIPLHIKNTFKPEDPGTLITNKANGSVSFIKGLTSIKDIALVSLKGPGMVGVPHFSHRFFKALARAGVNVILITQASSEHAISAAILPETISMAIEAIDQEFELEIAAGKVAPLKVKTALSILAIVGNKMQNQVGVSGKLFHVLGQNGVNVVAIAQGSSERIISAVIDNNNLKKALNSVHEAFFLSDAQSINVYIVGVGNVGATLLEQIKLQQDFLYQHYRIKIKVVGLANSKKMCFNAEGIDLNNWKDELQNGSSMNLSKFIATIAQLNLRNSIFVDNTASKEIATTYAEVLSKSVAVVTPNKVACSSTYKNYSFLKKLEQQFQTKFLFETNVGAGLPVISTLNDMVKCGDEILEVEGVLSGSLNFIFNTYDASQSFASVVKQAQAEGYTEPDPRLDISGKDVMRKLLILAREAGYALEAEDIKTLPCVPEHCMQFEGEAFYEALEKEEPYFKQLYKDASEQGEKIKYVARFTSNGAITQPELVASNHPFYHLEGKDNIVAFKSRRYYNQPLVIKGAGAGAEVTASGIFADIIKAVRT